MIRTANLTGSVSRNAGGLYESVRRLVQSLHMTGMEVCVFGTEDEHTAADIGAWAPVAVKAFHPRWPAKFGYSPEFRPALEEFAPDLTHTHGLWVYPSIATNHYCRRRGAPYLISAHGMLDPWAVRHSRWKKVLAHFLYESAHLHGAGCLRALCEPEARAIRQLGLKNPIAIIPNGIDLPEVGVQRSEAGTAPRSGLVEPGRKVLLYLGRIHPKKGLVNLLKAWKAARKAEEWTLAIAGWDQGGHEAELKSLCDELGIAWWKAREHPTFNLQPSMSNQKPAVGGQRSVVFLGPRFGAEKAACYRDCDAFVLPSFSEGVPMVVLEAWSYGKPVLMTPECNLPEGFAAGAAIRIAPEATSIGQGLRELFQAPPPALQALGENGRQLVCRRFVWPLIGEKMAELYQWMLGGGDKPSCLANF